MSALFSDAVLMRSLILLLILGSIAGFFAGAALLLRPDWMMHISKLADRWVSTRQITRPLVRSIIVDSWFYRQNRLSGALLLSGAIYIVYFFSAVFDKPGALNTVFKTAIIPPAVMTGLLDALVLACLIGAVFTAIVSLFLMLRPSMLREVELRANHKTSLRQVMKPLEIQRGGLDQYVFRNVRPVGMLILTGSIYTLVVLLNCMKNI